MENSSTPSFTNMLNSAMASSDHQQNPNSQQHGLQPPFPMNFSPYHFAPNFQTPFYPQGFHPFGGPSSFQQLHSSGYQQGIPFHGNFHGADGPSSPVASASMFGVGGGNGSRFEGSASPVSSPIPPVENTNKDPIIVEEWSDAGSDGEKIGGRMFWSEKDNLRLLSAWINNSNDPIDGNSKAGARYWKEVAAEYNKNAPKDRKRTPCSKSTLLQPIRLASPSLGHGRFAAAAAPSRQAGRLGGWPGGRATGFLSSSFGLLPHAAPSRQAGRTGAPASRVLSSSFVSSPAPGHAHDGSPASCCGCGRARCRRRAWWLLQP